MKLIERDNELAVLRDLFVESLTGRGRVAVVSGAVAIGKTALLKRFGEYSAEAGALVLYAAASRVEGTLPLGLISQFLHGAQLCTEKARHAAKLLNDGTVTAAMPGPESAERIGVAVARLLCVVVLELAARGPVVIMVDDLHYADPYSLQCLLHLVRRTGSARVLLVFAESPGQAPAHPQFHAELANQTHCSRLRLDPLSPSGVAAVFRQRLPVGSASRLAPAAYRVSGGNPLLTGALLDDCGPDGAAELVPGSSFGQAVVNCLYRCDSSTLGPARAIALLGDTASPAAVGELLDLDVEAASRAADELTAVGLLDRGRFRHSVARAAVLDGMAAEERAAHHARAAHIAHRRGLVAIVVARHIVAADRVRAPWVVPVLREGAGQALAGDEVGLAIDCLRLADEVCDNERQRAEIKLALARAEWRVDPSAAARHLPELTTAVRDGRLRPRQAMSAVGRLLWHGRTEEAVEAFRVVEESHVAEESDETEGPPGEATADCTENGVELWAMRLWLCYSYPDLLSGNRADQSLVNEADAPSACGPQLLAAGALATVLTRGLDEEALDGVEQVLRGSRLDDATLAPITAALASLIYSNRLDRAAAWCDSLLAEAVDRSAPLWRALIATLRATIHVRRGELAEAERSAREAFHLISPKAWGVGIGAPLACLLLVNTAMGRYDEAAAYDGMPVPEAMFQTPFGLHYLQARGRYYLETDRSQAALGDFLACGEMMTKWGFDLPTMVPWQTDAAQACLRLGRRPQARKLTLEQLARLRPEHVRTRGIALRVLAAASDLEERPRLLDEAARLLREFGDRFELAVTIADLSRAWRALGDHDQARELASRAYQEAERCGAEPLRRRLAAEIAELEPDPRPDPGPASPPGAGPIAELSDAELRVATLAAAGHTNREIARRLFITVSTVEQHLTRAYRKLNVRRRTDLPDGLRSASAC